MPGGQDGEVTFRLPPGFDAETELEIKRSRFVARLARVESERGARTLVAATRRRHPDARHHCSAFVVAVRGSSAIERSSDDGEPAGTAGAPMLAALRAADVDDVVVVVSRYFGGILLGTGGLARAYAGAVQGALAAAPRLEVIALPSFRVVAPHAHAGRVESAARAAGAEVWRAEYGEGATMWMTAPSGVELAALIAAASHGAATLVATGERVIERPAGC